VGSVYVARTRPAVAGAVDTFAILFAVDSVTQRFPSEPTAKPPGALIGNTLMTPDGVERSSWAAPASDTQMLPSAPVRMPPWLDVATDAGTA
jgi:hypothetical protein